MAARQGQAQVTTHAVTHTHTPEASDTHTWFERSQQVDSMTELPEASESLPGRVL